MSGRAVVRDDRVGADTGADINRDVAFAQLFKEEFPNVFHTIYRIVGDKEAALDVTQEAFTRAYAHWRRVSAYERPGAWVRRVAIRVAVRSLRSGVLQQRAVRRLSVPPPEAVGDPDLHTALAALPRMQRAAIVLHYFEDRPIVEVAELMGCSPGNAKVRLHRARKRLGELLGEEVDDVAR